MSAFSEAELERYARHIVLREIGGPGQRRLKAARVLVIGAGGLGSSALLYLAAAGVGTLGVVDDDAVALSNLQRQIVHRTEAVGRPKTESAGAAIGALNPEIAFRPHEERLDEGSAERLIGAYDLVCDGCDDPATRYLVNAACAALRRPLVSAAIGQWEGQLSTFRPWEGGPCYACLFPAPARPGLAPSCAEGGVLGALAGVMGSLQATEAVKEITGAGRGASGRLLLYDALSLEFRSLEAAKSPTCPICAGLDGA